VLRISGNSAAAMLAVVNPIANPRAIVFHLLKPERSRNYFGRARL
jgi:hypothetical protein